MSALSLRARLLLSVIGLVTVALVAAGVATYALLQKSLTDQLDTTLRADIHYAFGTWREYNGGSPGFGGPGPGPGFAPGTYMALLSPAGKQVGAAIEITSPSGGGKGTPQLPHQLPAGTETSPALFSVEGNGAVGHYRVAEAPLDEADGDTFLLAEPLTTIDATLNRLLLLEGLVGVLVLLTAGGLAWWLVRASLRPLTRIEDTAAAIAAGDLTSRVETAAPGTEVGRLGLALNAMLAQIESAFAERTRSEHQLRQFMAAASHELRTPLTSIRGYAEMLRRGAEGSEHDAGVARRRIEEESVRMTGLVDDMLLLARLDQGRPLESQRVDLARLASDACADARAVAAARTIELDAPEHLWLTGDEARLRQAIGNLVRNSLVHTPAGRPIDVTVRQEDGHALLDVVDHGPGLDADEKRRIFEPFYRGDRGRSRDRGGSGLGLSIVTAVVSAHSGQVQVLDTEGGGATFRVRLPIIAADAPAPTRVELGDEPAGLVQPGELSTT